MAKKIGEIIINDTYYSGKDLYSDGAVEDELLDIVQHYPEKEYSRVIAERKSWPVLYHLSSIRQNVLSFIDIKKDETVLEVGSGCGAITGVLSDKARSVTCIELSEKRSLINAWRNKDRSNIEIMLGNFETIEPNLTEQYDVITLIGVLEYAQLYISGSEPYTNFISIIRKHLKPGGRIIVAIENKLGMKYWAGCQEDHLGGYFVGVEDYRGGRNIRTFTKRELAEIFAAAGFADVQWYYPHPDYKLPLSIFSDDRLPSKGSLDANIRNFDRDRFVLFDESLVFDNVLQENEFPLFANSFIAILGGRKDAGEKAAEKIIYTKYSNDRASAYAIRTDILMAADGTKRIRKCPASPEGRAHIHALAVDYEDLSARYAGTDLIFNTAKEEEEGVGFEFLQGTDMEETLRGKIETGDREGIRRFLADYRQLVCTDPLAKTFAMTEEFKSIFGDVKVAADSPASSVTDIDLIFPNLIRTGDKWTAIDYEWTYHFPIPQKYVLYRTFLYWYQNPNVSKMFDWAELMQLGGIRADEETVFAQMEKGFQASILRGMKPLRDLYADFGCLAYPLYEAAKSAEQRRVHIYNDRGAGYGEADSFFPHTDAPVYGIFDEEIPIEKGVLQIRIDPCEVSCIVTVQEMTGRTDEETYPVPFTSNGFPLGENAVFFETTDPWFVAPLREGTVSAHLVFTVSPLNGQSASELKASMEHAGMFAGDKPAEKGHAFSGLFHKKS